jgi:hypothetical protein
MVLFYPGKRGHDNILTLAHLKTMCLKVRLKINCRPVFRKVSDSLKLCLSQFSEEIFLLPGKQKPSFWLKVWFLRPF